MRASPTENERLRDALMALWVYLRLDINHRTHKRFGEACGEDACILCLAAETAKAALEEASDAS